MTLVSAPLTVAWRFCARTFSVCVYSPSPEHALTCLPQLSVDSWGHLSSTCRLWAECPCSERSPGKACIGSCSVPGAGILRGHLLRPHFFHNRPFRPWISAQCPDQWLTPRAGLHPHILFAPASVVRGWTVFLNAWQDSRIPPPCSPACCLTPPVSRCPSH